MGIQKSQSGGFPWTLEEPHLDAILVIILWAKYETPLLTNFAFLCNNPLIIYIVLCNKQSMVRWELGRAWRKQRRLL